MVVCVRVSPSVVRISHCSACQRAASSALRSSLDPPDLITAWRCPKPAKNDYRDPTTRHTHERRPHTHTKTHHTQPIPIIRRHVRVAWAFLCKMVAPSETPGRLLPGPGQQMRGAARGCVFVVSCVAWHLRRKARARPRPISSDLWRAEFGWGKCQQQSIEGHTAVVGGVRQPSIAAGRPHRALRQTRFQMRVDRARPASHLLAPLREDALDRSDGRPGPISSNCRSAIDPARMDQNRWGSSW